MNGDDEMLVEWQDGARSKVSFPKVYVLFVEHLADICARFVRLRWIRWECDMYLQRLNS